MRSRAPLFVLLFAASSFALPTLAHAAIPFFGPVIDQSWFVSNTNPPVQCPLGWGALIMVVNNLISLLITLAIVLVAPLMIAWSGFLFVVNPVNAAGKEQAKKILTNTIVGIVIALAGWMIVDAIMAVLYNGKLGAWSSLITSGGQLPCLPQEGVGTGLNQAPLTSVSANGALNVPLSSQQKGTACDPAAVQTAAAAGGYTISTTQANIFACLAKPESSCGGQNQNGKWGQGSSAAGAFQVLLSTNSNCYNNPVCSQAAGVPDSLNCNSAFSGGNPKSDPASQTLVQECLKAAGNLTCSATAAACLLQQNNGSFSAWQADAKSSVQTACINNGGA